MKPTRTDEVLILVLMEDGLRAVSTTEISSSSRLNPCSYGRWSQSAIRTNAADFGAAEVLILVLMEDGLRD